MSLAVAIGIALRRWHTHAYPAEKSSDSEQDYIVSSVMGLLALLLGFTFSIAVERFDTRRERVLEEANAIGMTYLRAQLLQEPHRARMTGLLLHYTENRIRLAKAPPGPDQAQLLTVNDALITDIWAATSAAFDSIKGLDFSSVYLETVNHLIDMDAARKTARAARVPPEIFAVLLAYLVTAAGVLGFVLSGVQGRYTAIFLLALFTMSLMLIIDIDRPTLGSIVESQQPMEDLLKSLNARPPAVFEKWHSQETVKEPIG